MAIISPTLTANNIPMMHVANASSNAANAFRVFDGNNGTAWQPSTNAANEWISIDLGVNAGVDGYSLTCSNIATQAPLSFRLQGSINNSTWFDLDIQTNLTTGWTNDVPRLFGVNNLSNVNVALGGISTSTNSFNWFRYYRLLLNAQTAGITSISEFVLTKTDYLINAKYDEISPIITGNPVIITADTVYTFLSTQYAFNLTGILTVDTPSGSSGTTRPTTGQLFPRGIY